ncbi:MAG: Wzz/FepE/Etk N-terminal domain-containing protein [Steroidobacteraceae bacterium]
MKAQSKGMGLGSSRRRAEAIPGSRGAGRRIMDWVHFGVVSLSPGNSKSPSSSLQPARDMDQTAASPVSRDEFTLRDLAADFWASKFAYSIMIGIFVVAGVAIGILSPKEYEATTVVMAATDDTSSHLGSLGSLAAQYGGLASLAGITLPESSKQVEAIAVLKSELLTQRFIEQNDLLPVLYPKLWNPQTKTWRTSDPQETPTLWKANRVFANKIRAVEEGRGGLVTLKITWTNPQAAADWANQLVAMTNSYLRNKAIAEAERNIAYLNEQASKTTVLEARQAIFSLLESEIDREMVARGRTEYALRVIDPAFAPDKPSSAGPKLLGLLGFGLGFTMAALLTLGKRAFGP